MDFDAHILYGSMLLGHQYQTSLQHRAFTIEDILQKWRYSVQVVLMKLLLHSASHG